MQPGHARRAVNEEDAMDLVVETIRGVVKALLKLTEASILLVRKNAVDVEAKRVALLSFFPFAFSPYQGASHTLSSRLASAVQLAGSTTTRAICSAVTAT